MQLQFWSVLVISLAALLILNFLFVFLFVRVMYKKPKIGQAIIRNKNIGEYDVSFNGVLVLPLVHSSEIADLTEKSILFEKCCGTWDVRVKVRVAKNENTIRELCVRYGTQALGTETQLREAIKKKLVKIVEDNLARDNPAREVVEENIRKELISDFPEYCFEDVDLLQT